MIAEVTLPPELTKAAESLEQRLHLLSVPTRKVSMAEWNSMPEAIHHVVPSWIPALLSRFSLLGSVLECRHNQQNATWERCFCFWGPAEYTMNLFGESHYCFKDEFIAEGLVMISDEADGDMWLTSISGGPTSPIYLFDLSGHEKVLASSRMALLMASMAVSGESFHSFGKSERMRSVMWHPAD
jgi:hypothetical protein